MSEPVRCEIDVRDNAIHCAGCETRIQTTLARMPGVKNVRADHKTQKVYLTLGPEASTKKIKEKLDDLGFPTAPDGA